jgi:hypothetical protein
MVASANTVFHTRQNFEIPVRMGQIQGVGSRNVLKNTATSVSKWAACDIMKALRLIFMAWAPHLLRMLHTFLYWIYSVWSGLSAQSVHDLSIFFIEIWGLEYLLLCRGYRPLQKLVKMHKSNIASGPFGEGYRNKTFYELIPDRQVLIQYSPGGQ